MVKGRFNLPFIGDRMHIDIDILDLDAQSTLSTF
jgi:hypothetical protein